MQPVTMEDPSFSHDQLIDCFTKQLSELELFQTMYTPREIIITNMEVMSGIQDFVEKKTIFTPNHLDYTIIHNVDKLKLEISVHLPSIYPEVAPEIYVRCNQLNRQQEKSLNADLTSYMHSKHDGEVCVYTAILWLQDNIDKYALEIPMCHANENPETEKIFSRYWIYSHHIYSKKKTEDIVKACKELHLKGFCLLGKPGVICVEGNENDCKEWWKIIKGLHWQKIGIRITENFKYDEKLKQNKFQHFDVLRYPSSTNHTDMRSFQKYITDHGLIEQHNQFFGVPS